MYVNLALQVTTLFLRKWQEEKLHKTRQTVNL